MILSTSSFNKAAVLLFVGLFCLSGCIGTKEDVRRNSSTREEKFSIAVFPIENLSGTIAPLKEIRGSLINQLETRGFDVLEEEALEKFIARNRVRYTGGIDETMAQAFRKQTGIDGILITSLEFYSEMNPPKIALTSRLVSTDENPVILWIDGIGLAGDDSPGILGLGLIEDPKALLKKGVETLTESLEDYFKKKTERRDVKSVKKKFQPKTYYRLDLLDPGRKYTVAVIPFFNRSERKNAGEVMVLQFIRNLKKFEYFDVIELGVIRRELLTLRIIMDEGISLANADGLFITLNADLILTGKVIDYQDYQGIYGKPKVDFSAQLIERRSRKVVWSSINYNEGDDGVFFFDRGRVNTAHAMASQMTQWIGKMILEDSKRGQGGKGSSGQK